MEWRRIAGFRVVVSCPQTGCAPPPSIPVSLRARAAGLAGALLVMVGALAIGVAIAAQVHAPQPPPSAAGATGPGKGHGPSLRRSLPVAVDIPAIGVHARLLRLGVNRNGTLQVPSLTTRASEAAWYKYSATPGQIGSSVIEGHVDTIRGPAVFLRLADGITAVFRVTGVRRYVKSHFPAKVIYRTRGFAALHLITCGGAFNYKTRNYLSSIVVFAALTSSRPAGD